MNQVLALQTSLEADEPQGTGLELRPCSDFSIICSITSD
jgi:hypothetical protein